MVSRREFVKDCGYKCIGLIGFSVFLESCKPLKQINASSNERIVSVAASEFGEESKKSRRSLLVRVPELPVPILLYEFDKKQYSAVLLQCTHQGAELGVNGNILTCPAHGSEFDNKGTVIQGPAEHSLTSYRVSIDSENILIHLS